MINWSKHNSLLGVKSDKEIAQIVGCTESNVRHRRKRLKIAPAIYANWTSEDERLMDSGAMECTKCREVLLLSSFYEGKSYRHGRRRDCISCYNDSNRNRRMQTKAKYIKELGGKCQDCDFDKHISSLQFHHICSNCHDAYHGGELNLEFSKAPLGWIVSK